jgi:hypothetical protein
MYEPVADKQVLVYKDNGKPVYAYATTEFLKPELVNNLLVNSYNFTDTVGWKTSNNTPVTVVTFPLAGYD